SQLVDLADFPDFPRGRDDLSRKRVLCSRRRENGADPAGGLARLSARSTQYPCARGDRGSQREASDVLAGKSIPVEVAHGGSSVDGVVDRFCTDSGTPKRITRRRLLTVAGK